MNSDLLIIGGGVIGLSIARECHKRGVGRITLVEKGRCGEESSWAAAGMLGVQAEADEGGPFFDMCSASRDLYPAFAAELLDETGIDIELERSGTIVFEDSDEFPGKACSRFYWQRDAGLDVEWLDAIDICLREPHVTSVGRTAFFFPKDWQVENRKLLAALQRYADLNGISVVENTRVEDLILENGRVIGADTTCGPMYGNHCVVATGTWTSLIKLGGAKMPVAVTPVRGQIICLRSEPGRYQHVMYSGDGYVVPRADGRVLVGSTSEFVGFEKAVTEQAVEDLRRIAAKILTWIDGMEIIDQWCGLRPRAADSMPVLGGVSGIEGLTIATGHYRNGILLAPLTANIIAESLMSGIDPDHFTMFGPGRFRRRDVVT
jgi:glycine oxidase